MTNATSGHRGDDEQARATSVVSFGTGAKLIPRISAPTSTIESTPPKLSTGSVVSFTWLGDEPSAITSAISASGSVIRKTEPHQ